MDIDRLPALRPLIDRLLASDAEVDSAQRAQAENLVLDERPPDAGVELYGRCIAEAEIGNCDEWMKRHVGRYVDSHIEIDNDETETPWSFRDANGRNRLPSIDPRIHLIRVEDADWVCHQTAVETVETLRSLIEKRDETALEKVAERLNEVRDKRPMFVSTELELEDILSSADNDPAWAERLRDRLGLGHFDPTPGEKPLSVLIMRYTVEEALRAMPEGMVVPTVLDGRLSPFFYPSPIPGAAAQKEACLGRTVNLTPCDNDNNYVMGCELLHPRIDYRPEHFWRIGEIAAPVRMSLERARRFHLPWLRVYAERDDYGADLPKRERS